MEFTPHFKRKRKSSQSYLKLVPFPHCQNGKPYHGVFNGLCVEVKDSEEAQIGTLYENGCYGKGSRSRGGPATGMTSETLLLGLEEACMLCYFLEALEIRDLSGSKLNFETYLKWALEYDDKFVYKLAAYLYLKSKNWIIKSGIKFGGDFLIYKQGPSQYHASFLVIVQTPSKNPDSHYVAKNLKGIQRVAETSDKDVLVLRLNQPSDFDVTLVTLETLESLNIEETVIRRFNYTSFVQSKQKQ
ncbi:tRNA-splicing endonuclease subunit Sen2-1 [Drosophila innubila]|uniref:tRNA-splicing endonuclease subunit Sen2-1 n=1 Tax=Drosophila innubila TaxID=198719 RepID=UPI00148C12CD|nr:tRNA-splicing endonuclease subunit Sen2-1 [Drosophila innubila]